MEFGKLNQIDIRKAWASESSSFTPWLVENIELLGDALGIDIDKQSVSAEANVGNFRADIRCKASEEDTVILIENQLEDSDHKHMGQLVTYAAGFEAAKVVWIARTIRDEHGAALDWLNRHTQDDIAFFGLEIKLWQIGDSEPAPKFEIVSKPNDWQRLTQRSTELSALSKSQLEYWQLLRERLIESGSAVKPQSPRGQHWMFFGIGRSGFNLQATIKMSSNEAEVSVNIPLDFFQEFEDKRIEYGNKIGTELKISRGKKRYSRLVVIDRFELDNRDSWSSCADWMCEQLEKFNDAFRVDIRDAISNTIEPEYEASVE